MLPAMNRQLRRAQAKQDKKAEQEKQKKKDARRDRISELKERRTRRREAARRQAAAKPAPAKSVDVASLSAADKKKLPGRFSGAFMIATVFFIVLQAVAPDPEAGLLGSFTGAGFFLLFGYFSALNLERRGMANSLTFTVISGVALAGGVTAARILSPGGSADWLMTGLGLLGVVGGAYLGRWVFKTARR